MTEASPDAAPDADTYALKARAECELPAPDLPWRAPMPARYSPCIGVIGTGGISGSHLAAYRTAGWEVAALWNRTRAKAEAKAIEYYPSARITDSWQELLADPRIDVVDIALHPEQRTPIIEAALRAGKHVLSEKPFVSDLETGERLIALSEEHGVHLAVNQTGRWAPHLAWMRSAVEAGLVGQVISVHLAMNWDHGWTAGTPFDQIDDLILYDFGIHRFDFIASILGERMQSVFATVAHAPDQRNRVPLLAQVLVRAAEGQASLILDGAVPHGPGDSTVITGTRGTLRAHGPDLGTQQVSLSTVEGVSRPVLEGHWFEDGFRGTMGELLCAIETGQPPGNSARANLRSLALTFAAVESRVTGREIAIGAVRRLRG